MASIASSSNTSQQPREETRLEAGPLPTKRGEIGYVEGANTEAERSPSPLAPLPARHPADRDAPDTTTPVPPTNSTTSTVNHAAASPSTSTLISTTNSTTKKKKPILGFFKPKRVPIFGGFLLTTLVAAVCQMLALAATIIGWVFAAQRLAHIQSGVAPSSLIFVHVIFGISILGQLLFFERRIFRLRAERYSYLHPGEILPSSRNRGGSDPSIAFSPWNRPPLPTYAAALAQSGLGTGDVEDHIIAVPPPPAYGNTRGSTMLLSGYMRDSLRAQRPVSGHSQLSHGGERPVSYASRDEQWEEVEDAERARRLEETLSRLERPGSRV